MNLCVTHAMREHMISEWSIRPATVYDKPPSWKFKILDVEQRHQLFWRLSQSVSDFASFKSPVNEANENEGKFFS